MSQLRLTVVLLAWLVLPVVIAAAEFQPPPINVPDGFTVELAAAPPLVKHPMMAGFDDRGRLFVAESAGLNMKADDLVKETPNSVLMLEDTDGDGVFDNRTVFADKMTLPMGALWHDGALYVAAPPNIWRLEDTDDDGVADKREVIVDTFGFSGNAASVHGCFLGPCGRIYWCDGRHGHEFREGKTVTSKGLAARIFSCKPDGSDVQVYCGGGMDNPVEVTFTPEGEMLGTVAIFLSRPRRRDALVHWMYGGVYPHHHALREFPRTGDLLPPLSLFGQVAPSGVMRYRGGHLGADFRNNIFIAQFNTHKIVRTTIERSGSTFASRDEDFLVSPSSDFHPTDVLEDADGSLLVVDTGGWFRIGCPLSKIAKPNIYGAIYRVRKTEGETADDPRGGKIDWAHASPKQLASLLSDPRFAVRDRAIAALAAVGNSAVPALEKSLAEKSDAARRNVVWALSRIDSEQSRAGIRKALDDRALTVRLAAVRSLGTLHDVDSLDRLRQLVLTDEPPVRREAATALGRIGSPRVVSVLLQSLQQPADRLLEHAILYALIEIDAPEETVKGLASDNPLVQRGALIALDQMASGELTREMVTPLLDTNDGALLQTALEIVTTRPGWSDEILELLAEWLTDPAEVGRRKSMIRGALSAFVREPKIQELIAKTLASSKNGGESKLLLLDVIAHSDMPELPAVWKAPLGRLLDANDPQTVKATVQAIRRYDSDVFDERLAMLSGNSSTPTEICVAALGAIIARRPQLTDEAFALLLSQFEDEVAALDQLAAADVLGRAKLQPDQLLALAKQLPEVGPLQLPGLLPAFKSGQNEQVGLALAASLTAADGADVLTLPQLKETFAGYPAPVQKAIKPLVERLASQSAEQDQRMKSLESALTAGDAQAGRKVFFGSKAACFACHRVAGEGGQVGPDLTTIGQVRTRRDLLEAVVFPSASFARGYQPYSIVTDRGKMFAGILSRESADAVSLVTAQRTELRIPRTSIEEMIPSKTSIMPQGLDRSLTNTELSDLMAYLQSLK